MQHLLELNYLSAANDDINEDHQLEVSQNTSVRSWHKVCFSLSRSNVQHSSAFRRCYCSAACAAAAVSVREKLSLGFLVRKYISLIHHES